MGDLGGGPQIGAIWDKKAKQVQDARRPQMPTPPKAPAKDIGEPFRAGDRVLDHRDTTSMQDVSGPPGNRKMRPVSMREDRDTRRHIRGGAREWNKSMQRKISAPRLAGKR